jgi:hypothetical protein
MTYDLVSSAKYRHARSVLIRIFNRRYSESTDSVNEPKSFCLSVRSTVVVVDCFALSLAPSARMKLGNS